MSEKSHPSEQETDTEQPHAPQPKSFMDRYRGTLIAIAVVGLLVFLMIFNSTC